MSNNILYSTVTVNFDITYEDLLEAIEGWELVLQEGVIQHADEVLGCRKFANQVCMLAMVMSEVRQALLPAAAVAE